MSDESPFDNLARMAGVALTAGIFFLAARAGKSGAAAHEASEDAPDFSSLDGFDGIALNGPDIAIMTVGARCTVDVDGDPAAINRLRITVRDGVLHVARRPQRRHAGQEQSVTVRIALPALRRASLSGSGELRIACLSGARVEASVAGSGDLIIEQVDAGEARLSLAGSGAIVAAGTAEALVVSIAGSGDVEAGRLRARTASVSIAGSGDAYVHASQSARVSILGSGDAMIRGTPDCQVSKFGSGDVHCTA